MGESVHVVIEFQGRWWLPEHSDHKVFGISRWDVTGGGTLQLEGELQPVLLKDNVLPGGDVQKYRDDRPDDPREYPVVFGRTDRRALTLLQAFRLSVARWGLEESPERIHVNRFIDGAWFDDPEELRVDRVIVQLAHATSWVGNTGLTVDYPSVTAAKRTGEPWAVVTARALPTFDSDRNGDLVRFVQELRPTGDGVHKSGIEQNWSLVLARTEPEPLEGFIELVSDVQDLISIAVGKAAAIVEVKLQHPDVPEYSLAGVAFPSSRQDLIYHSQWTPRSDGIDQARRADMYFSFDSWGGVAGVRRWLDVVANYRTELGRVMATRYSPDMYLEDRIMNVCAALDSLDRQRRGTGKYVKYSDRIKECVAFAGKPFTELVVDAEAWTERVVETRDDLAHHHDRFRTVGSVGEHLLSEQLYWLFVLNLLKLAQPPSAVFDEIARNSQFRWISDRARLRATPTA